MIVWLLVWTILESLDMDCYGQSTPVMDSDSLSSNRSRLESGLAIPLIRANRLHHSDVQMGSRTKSECRELLVWLWFPLKV